MVNITDVKQILQFAIDAEIKVSDCSIDYRGAFAAVVRRLRPVPRVVETWFYSEARDI